MPNCQNACSLVSDRGEARGNRFEFVTAVGRVLAGQRARRTKRLRRIGGAMRSTTDGKQDSCSQIAGWDKTRQIAEHEGRGKLGLLDERMTRQDCIGSRRRGMNGSSGGGGGGGGDDWGLQRYNEIQEGRKSERYPFSYLRGEWMLCERTAEKTRIPMYACNLLPPAYVSRLCKSKDVAEDRRGWLGA
ncbi:hypothetical protein K0M31_002994 [Melipona bicolor]|uniref:Uncharacterized protein n=1 Tax=Melipona bicolor TaxID=60889 RepID=A0AA40KQ13_9HYME|nr:hypothetical protein K0M31_002994 [Melipona bicolor]